MGFSRVHPGQKTANDPAIANGLEAVWQKALGYVTREPYRSQIAAELVRHRVHKALSKKVTKQVALATLTLARATSPEYLPALVYVTLRLAIILPVVRTRWLRPIRRSILAFAFLRRAFTGTTLLTGNSGAGL
jgi:hypothetical protein